MLSLFGSMVSNVAKTVASNAMQLVSAYILFDTYRNYNNNNLTWRDALRRLGAVTINFGFFYASSALARGAAQSAFPYIYGDQPSALWHPFSALEWYCKETRVIDYAIDYGPMVMPFVGLVVSNQIVKGAEKLGSKVLEVGADVSAGLAKNATLMFSSMSGASTQSTSVALTGQESRKTHRKK